MAQKHETGWRGLHIRTPAQVEGLQLRGRHDAAQL